MRGDGMWPDALITLAIVVLLAWKAPRAFRVLLVVVAGLILVAVMAAMFA